MTRYSTVRQVRSCIGDTLQRRHSVRILQYIVLAWMAALTGGPLVWLLATSVKQRQEVITTLLPTRIDLSNYARVWTELNLAQHFTNSFVVSLLTVSVVVMTSTLAAYAFARLDFPGRSILYYVFLAAIAIPGHAILIPMFAFLKAIGLLNTLPGLSASLLGLAIPVSVFVMRAYFAALPSELGDAARIDGASEFGVFLRIYLPLARPGLAAVVIFQFVATWNEFFFSTALISDPRLKTIQPGVYQAVGRYSIDYPLLSAGLVVALLPILAIFVLMQRQFVEGLTAGALKA